MVVPVSTVRIERLSRRAADVLHRVDDLDRRIDTLDAPAVIADLREAVRGIAHDLGELAIEDAQWRG